MRFIFSASQGRKNVSKATRYLAARVALVSHGGTLSAEAWEGTRPGSSGEGKPVKESELSAPKPLPGFRCAHSAWIQSSSLQAVGCCVCSRQTGWGNPTEPHQHLQVHMELGSTAKGRGYQKLSWESAPSPAVLWTGAPPQ